MNYRERSMSKSLGALAIVFVLVFSAMIMPVSGVNAETNSEENIENYIVYGTLVDKYGIPIDTAIVVAVNMDSGNSTWVYGENGTYSLDLADINGTVNIGDSIKLIASNGICISNYTFVVEGNSSKRIDFILDPEEPTPPNIENPFNPDNPFENSSSPEITMPEYKPDLIVTDLTFSDDRPIQGDIVTLTATITTTGLFVESFDVAFYLDQKEDEHYIASKSITPSPLEVTTSVSVIWNTYDVVGYHNIIAVVDAENKIDESNETNNELFKEICIVTVEFLIDESINQINDLKTTVSSLLSSSDANKINQHLDHAVDWLADTLEEYNENEIEDAIKDLHHATDETWKGIEETNKLWGQNKLTEAEAKDLINSMKDVTYLIIETSYIILHSDTAKDITNVEVIIVETRMAYLFEKLSHDCDKVDNKLANALQHYQKAMEALAEDKDYLEEIEHGYGKLLKAKEDIVDLVEKGKITSEFGNWTTMQINNAILVFPPELSITPYDIVIEGVAAKGYETTITVTVKNTGIVYAENINVDVYEMSEPVLISSYTIGRLDAGASDTTIVDWTPTTDGTHDIQVVLDAENKVVEPTKEDNVVSSGVFILSTYATPRAADWIITGETIVENQTIIMYNDQTWNETLYPMACNVIITSNATSNGYLKLINSNLTIVSGIDGQYSLRIDPDCRLDILNNSVVTAQQEAKAYHFKVYGELNIDSDLKNGKGRSEVWYTYGNKTDSSKPGGIQLYSTSNCNIKNSTVIRGQTHNIYCDNAMLKIVNSNISKAGYFSGIGNGIYCINMVNLTIKNCDVANNKEAGIYLYNMSNNETEQIFGNNITNNAKYGIYMNASVTDIKNNNISKNNVGIQVENSNTTITNTNISGAELPRVDGTPNEWALICGSSTDFVTPLFPAYRAFINRGVNDSHIRFMLNYGGYDIPQDIRDGVDIHNENVNKSNFFAELENFSNNLTEDDELWIFLCDHGGNGIFAFQYPGPNWHYMYYSELDGYLDNINCSVMPVVIAACSAATALEPLRDPKRICVVSDHGMASAHEMDIFWGCIGEGEDITDAFISTSGGCEVFMEVGSEINPSAAGIVSNNSEVIIQQCAITRNNNMAINLYNSTLNITDSILDECGYVGDSPSTIKCINSSAYVYNCTISRSLNGIFCEGDYNCIITNNHIRECGKGIIFYNQNNSSISNCSLYNSTALAIQVINSTSNLITNCAVYNNYDGIYLGNSYNNQIINCGVYTNVNGIYLWGSSNNQISNCTTYDNWEGILLSYSSNNQIINCTTYNNGYGIYLSYSSNNQISNCTTYNNRDGILLGYSSNNTITNCNAYNNYGGGIWLDSSSNNNITNSYVYNNYGRGITLESSSNNNQITNCNVYNDDCGIVYRYSSSNNTITNCSVYNNNYYGIRLDFSSNNNTITNSYVYNNYYYGIYLESASNNQITNSYVYNNYYYGIYLVSSSNNNITNCYVYNDPNGIYLVSSSNNNTITNCDVYNNDYGIVLSSNNNIIIRSKIYSNSYGTSIFSDNNIISGSKIYDNSNGIYVVSSSCTISDNAIDGNSHGIYCIDNSAPIVDDNHIVSNVYGIYSEHSSPTISGNDIWDNSEYGVYSVYSNSTILNNSINGNSYGIYYADSDEGLIAGNSIIGHAHTRVADVVGMHTFYTSYGYGIFCQDASPMIKDDNLIARNLKGIVCNNSFSSISNNTIRDHNREYPFFTAPDRLTGRMVTHYIWMGQGVTEDSCIVDIHDNEFITNRADISVYNSTGTIESNNISGTVPPLEPFEVIASPPVGVQGFESQLNIFNTVISERARGVSLSASNVTITNCTIIDGISTAFVLDECSLVECLNTDFDKSKVQFNDDYSVLNVSWYLHVRVVEIEPVAPIPIENANVTIYNKTGDWIFTGLTDLNGWIKWVVIQEYMQNKTEKIFYTPHIINATKIGYNPDQKEVGVHYSQTIIFELTWLGI